MKERHYPAISQQVYLFGTCVIDLFMPEAGLDAVRLLEREGITVHFPRGQSCCGQPAYSSGNPEQARAVALAQLDLFAQPWPVIVPSGSCAGMMRHHWPKLFENDPVAGPKARDLAERVFELSEYLVRVLDVRYPAQPQDNERVVLHTSCGARREMGTRAHGVALLDSLPGVERVEHVRESECCGFGGTFCLKHSDISGAMVKDKVASACGTGCERLVSADCGCLLNIGHAARHQGAPLTVEHMASFLWRRANGIAASEGGAQ
ncbi:(Fe-S)-binding protein [Pseudoduganella namucuonensis]|uniref:L-lactate dehydrogenase complex protein LldE n=1 Tax=Pseudoduganella namucuonensis TaxID=1035707 RepID=A0A1I7M806_9BURK|nr:(Fe-S)-binding protein [Pseudoduganella namucuonensis]SFV18053.1 L-lactate dehydrogenase complex protein LldE [Pseudoduganella namucuonensis]